MNLTEASAFLGLNPRTLRLAVERREIEAEHPLPDGPWVFKRQALETEAAANLVWARLLGNKDLTEAILSRLRHQCQTIHINGPSLREPQG